MKNYINKIYNNKTNFIDIDCLYLENYSDNIINQLNKYTNTKDKSIILHNLDKCQFKIIQEILKYTIGENNFKAENYGFVVNDIYNITTEIALLNKFYKIK